MSILRMSQIVLRRRTSLPPVDTPVPPILDGVVASIAQTPGDFCPALAHFLDQLLDPFTFLWRYRIVVQAGLEVLVVTLTTLLRRAVLQLL